jgi:ribose 5-phosphate isomerase A
MFGKSATKSISQDELKRMAADAALSEVIKEFKSGNSYPDPLFLGIGTGSTVRHFIELLGEWMQKESLRSEHIQLISSSQASVKLLQEYSLSTETGRGEKIDIYIDGADEANDKLQLIKGGGAALTGEKILVNKSKKFICIIDESKLVKVLGAFPLPMEITKMAYYQSELASELLKLGGQPTLRMDVNTQKPVETEHGNYIYDVRFNKITDPSKLYQDLIDISDAHILTNGLFINNHAANMLIIAKKNGEIEYIK